MIAQSLDSACVDRCAGDSMLQACTGGMMACPLGCSEMGGAHCRVWQPAGGAVTPADLAMAGAPVTLTGTTVVHGDTGEIEGVRPAGTGTMAGIGFKVLEEFRSSGFRFKEMMIAMMRSGEFPSEGGQVSAARNH